MPTRGSIQVLVGRYLQGHNIDVPLGKCLIRGGSQSHSDYDLSQVKIFRAKCDTTHCFRTLSGIYDAALIGARRNTASNTTPATPATDPIATSREGQFLAFLERLFFKENGSHLCGNSMCSDPFHIIPEPHKENQSRNFCLRGEGQVWTHLPPCRVELRWSDAKKWREIQADTLATTASLPRPLWTCSNPINTRHFPLRGLGNHWDMNMLLGRESRFKGTCPGGSWTQIEGGSEKPKYVAPT